METYLDEPCFHLSDVDGGAGLEALTGRVRGEGPIGLTVFNLPLVELLAVGRGTPRRRLPALRGISGEAPAMDGFSAQRCIRRSCPRPVGGPKMTTSLAPADRGFGHRRTPGKRPPEEDWECWGGSRVWMGASRGGRRRGGARGCSDTSGARRRLRWPWETGRGSGRDWSGQGGCWEGVREVGVFVGRGEGLI